MKNMRKNNFGISIISLIITIIVLSGILIYYIFNKKEYITCTKKSMNEDYTLLSNYKIYYKNIIRYYLACSNWRVFVV